MSNKKLDENSQLADVYSCQMHVFMSNQLLPTKQLKLTNIIIINVKLKILILNKRTKIIIEGLYYVKGRPTEYGGLEARYLYLSLSWHQTTLGKT